MVKAAWCWKQVFSAYSMKKDSSSWEKKEGKQKWEADNEGFLRRGPVPACEVWAKPIIELK